MSHAVGVYLIVQSGSRSNLGAAPQFAFPLYTLFLLRGNGAKERAKVKAGVPPLFQPIRAADPLKKEKGTDFSVHTVFFGKTYILVR